MFLFSIPQVELTWDETDKDRTAVTMRKFDKDELEEMDVKQYLASSSSEGEDGEHDEEISWGLFLHYWLCVRRSCLQGRVIVPKVNDTKLWWWQLLQRFAIQMIWNFVGSFIGMIFCDVPYGIGLGRHWLG